MDIDEAGRHEQALDIELDRGGGGGEVANPGDVAVGDSYVAWIALQSGAVKDGSVAKNDVERLTLRVGVPSPRQQEQEPEAAH